MIAREVLIEMCAFTIVIEYKVFSSSPLWLSKTRDMMI
jgi:hypothetical protein